MNDKALQGIRRGLRDVQRMLAGDNSAGRIHRTAEIAKDKEYLPPTDRSPVTGAALRFHDRANHTDQD